jgi:small-conductance mechanosensitive channel
MEELKLFFYSLPNEWISVAFTIGFILAYIILRKLIKRGLMRFARLRGMDESRAVYISKVANILMIILLIMMLTLVWNVSFEGLGVYIASIFTILGVGFFAIWSILSNITASVVLYFYFPFRIGSYIKIMEGEKQWIGRIKDISLFTIRIQTTDGLDITYPNNLLIQKPVAFAENMEALMSPPEEKPVQTENQNDPENR